MAHTIIFAFGITKLPKLPKLPKATQNAPFGERRIFRVTFFEGVFQKNSKNSLRPLRPRRTLRLRRAPRRAILSHLLYTIKVIVCNMPRVRCEKCGSVAKTLYVRVSRRERHDFDKSDYKWKSQWLPIGYLCERCKCVKLKGKFYTEVE